MLAETFARLCEKDRKHYPFRIQIVPNLPGTVVALRPFERQRSIFMFEAGGNND